ncbi:MULTISPECIES: amino acid permease [unclassified Lebetimonas]|uniref:amino acid permease n=1 Tax=unclassified Lebetimonas TaxID=2648158 RepID=UPI000465FCC5|nr:MULTISPECIES: amino acid permease [unclassified Lebetimonas]
MNLIQGIATIVITLLGSGVFIVPAISATYSGWTALIAWFLTAVMILPVAFVFGKFGKMYPSAGGSATFVGTAFGKKFEKATSFLYLSIIPIGPPVVIITAASYLAGAFGKEYLVDFIILAAVIILILNLLSLNISSNINIFITITITSIIICFFIYALFQNFHITNHKLHIIKTLGIVFWCFVGIEALSHISHEFKNENDFFKAVVTGIITVAFLYMAVTFSVLVFNAYGNESKNLHSLVIIASKVMPYTDKLMAIIAFSICIMALNLYVAALTRLATTLNIEFKKALFIIMGIILVVSILKFKINFKVDLLITYANGVFVLIYFLVSLSALKILKNKISFFAVVSMSLIIFVIGFDMFYATAVFLIFIILQKRGLKNLEICE